MQSKVVRGSEAALLQPTTVEQLLAHRFVLLSTFAKFTPGFTKRTLAQWAESGKLPSKKGEDGRVWIDLRKLRVAFGDEELADLLHADPNAAV